MSSNPAAAFPLAALIISLFSNFTDLGELIMAHFYDQWPILVPCYIKENAAMTELDTLRLVVIKCYIPCYLPLIASLNCVCIH